MICEEEPIQSCSSLNDLSAASSLSDLGNPQQLYSYDDLVIVRKLNKAKFPVFLTYSPTINHYFAMKVFSYNNDKISPYFVNEARFAALDHENVISIAHFELEREAMFEEDFRKISYIVMELAPFGDFFDVTMTHKIQFDEKLARTYFRQLLEGLEYLHASGVAHLDLKLENLLLGENFILKIADFDQAHIKDQGPVVTRGTVCYRAPELILNACKLPEAADIYSAGIILFLFKTGGVLPHSEHQKFKGMDLFDLMNNDKRVFWEKHCEIQHKDSTFFDNDFKALFNAMVAFHPQERPTIAQIKLSKWYNKPVYSKEEVALIMSQQFSQIGK
jgi:serine/threonine protein kinase